MSRWHADPDHGRSRRPVRRPRPAPVRLVSAVAVLLSLSACSGDPGDPSPRAATTTTTVTSTSPSGPSITATRPALPPGAPTPASAVAFVRYFWESYNYAYTSLDPKLLSLASDPECAFCASVIASIKKSAPAGDTFEGGDVRVLDAHAPASRVTQARSRPGW